MKLNVFFISALATLLTHAIAVAHPDSVLVDKRGIKLKELPEPATLTWQKCVQLGDKLFEKGSIYNGLLYYTEAVTKNPAQTDLYFAIADGNFTLRDYQQANKYYKLLAELDGDKITNYTAWFQYALTSKFLGHYEEAKTIFRRVANAASGTTELAELRRVSALELEGCELGIQLRDRKKLKDYLVDLLDSNINQPFTDYAPFLCDSNTLYYGAWVSDEVILDGRTEKYATFSRIFTSKRNGNTWSKAQKINGVLDSVHFHTGNATFAPDGKTMYYTQCFQDDEQRMRCSIYKSSLRNEGWSIGDRLNINDPKATTTQPALGKDENGKSVLYFVSDRSGKSLDLYSAAINADGSLQEPKMLSSVVNTAGNEMSPFYNFTTNELYFSSDGLVNIGGLDVYKVALQNGAWQNPQHLGWPINSSVDDMYYNWNEAAKTGFFVSNRPGGFGLKSETCCDDIYRFRKNVVYIAVKGTLLDADSNQSVTNQPIHLIDAETGVVLKTVNSQNGTYFFDLQPDMNYKLSGQREGFFAAVQNFNTLGITKSDTLSFALSFQRMVKNKAYTLNNIYYDFDKAELRTNSKGVLDTLYMMLQENPSIVIELSSHTDSKGSDKYNLDLSQKRAESCVNYLVTEKGLPKQRISAKGYGESVPIAPNTNPDGRDNEDGRAKNRRTEFKIVGEMK